MKETDFIYGFRTVHEALSAGKNIDKILLFSQSKSEQLTDIVKLAQSKDIPVARVPLEKLNRTTKQNHQGIIAFISPIYYSDFSTVLAGIYEKGEDPFFLILDRISDVRNFGAICRTAEAAGVHAVIVPATGSARIGSDAMKTSAGAISHIPICRERNLNTTLRQLKDSGLHVVAASEKSDKKYLNATYDGPLAIIMGSEEDGVNDTLLKIADEQVSIPMLGKVQSLNVSVATGILLYQAMVNRK